MTTPSIPFNINPSTDSYTITFTKDDNSIRSETLIPFMQSFSEAMHLIAKEIDLDDNISVRIIAIAPGSFKVNVDFDLWRSKVLGLFTKEKQSKVREAIKTLSQLVILMGLLQGEPPTEVVTNRDGTVTIVKDSENVTIDNRTWIIHGENNRIVGAIANQNHALVTDDEIMGMKLTDENGSELLNLDRGGIQNASLPKSINSEDVKYTNEASLLTIVRISFDKKLVSTFVHKGKEISAYIRDEEFYDKIEKGERFGIGDILTAELKVKWILNTKINQYVIQKYEVIKVLSHKEMSQGSQMDLGF